MMRQSTSWVALMGLLLAGGRAWAEERLAMDRLLDGLFQVREFKETAISPDGRWLAWVVALPEKDFSTSTNSAIFVTDLTAPTEAPRRLTAGKGIKPYEEHDLAWSPDSSRLAFLSDREKKEQLQIYVMPSAGGPVQQITHLTGFLAGPRWSPDGKKLAALFTENAPRPAGPLQPATPDAGVVEEKIFEQRLTLVDLDSGKVRQLSPADHYVYEYDWSPNGQQFVVIAAPGSGDNNWWIAQLHVLDVATGAMKSLVKPPLQIAVPRWSPDGKTIAYIGGLMSDEGVIGGDIFAVPAMGGQPRNVTPGMKASAAWLEWLPDSHRLLFTEHKDGASGIATVEMTNGQITSLWLGNESFQARDHAFNLALTPDRQHSALIRQSFHQPPEVWAGPIGAWKQITHANTTAQPTWGKVKSWHWKNDGLDVQGWLLYPRDFDPKRRYPLVVSVHGGPASARRPRWPGTFFDPSVLSSEGYFVFFPNPRGSYGRGEKFVQGNVKDFGYGDLRDILTGVDEVLKTEPVDPQRLGILGWSYGGYMTMWAVTQTQRFRTAIAGAGIANWQSYYGENGIDQWMIPYFGASVYDDPAVYAKSSPITFIKKVKTPTLILVGDRDIECPVPQSYEFWHALKTLRVPTQLVVYPNEGHLIAQPKHRRDILRRTVEWLDRDLKEGASKDGAK